MIDISPAILTNKQEEFSSQFKRYDGKFTWIDIDVNVEGDSFTGKETVALSSFTELFTHAKSKLRFHLMVDSPEGPVREIANSKLNQKKYRILVHQHVKPQQAIEKYKDTADFGIVINPNENLKHPDFYNQFSEVQFMTVQPGWQGAKFEPESLYKLASLYEQGYTGELSIDGSVNLQTAEIIREFPIDRVSVGSFFSKHLDEVEIRKMKLELALNLKTED